jgi:hypothetical protein
MARASAVADRYPGRGAHCGVLVTLGAGPASRAGTTRRSETKQLSRDGQSRHSAGPARHLSAIGLDLGASEHHELGILSGAQILTRSGRWGPVVLAACAVSLARLLGLQLVPRPALNAMAPAIQAIEPSNRTRICVGWRRVLKHRALAQRAKTACP